MQNLWAQVLAGEANSPGTYSKRTVNFLASLDKKDAELFQSLCGYSWYIGDLIPLVFDAQDDIYNKNGINFNTLTHLDSIGLINFGGISSFSRQGLPKKFAVLYCGKPLTLTMQKEADNQLNIGQALFTQIGKELVKISNAPGVAGFDEYVKEKWKAHLPDNEKA